MKNKIVLSLIAFALTFVSIGASAQTVTLISTGNSLAKDTVTNTGVKTLATILKGYYETVTMSFQTVNISGTQGGTVIPVASNDGVNYYSCGVVYGGTSVTVTASLLGGVFYVPKGFAYYGLQWTGAGTMSGSITGKLVARKTTQ